MSTDRITPERIWIKPCNPCDRVDDYYLCDPKYLDGRETGYVRADLADAQAQEIARLRGCFEQIEKAALHGCLTPELVAQITRAALGDAQAQEIKQ